MQAVRAARAGEAESLTALCLRSKAHWGYDAEFMRRCVPSLTVSEEIIAQGRVLVATDDAGHAIQRRSAAALAGSCSAKRSSWRAGWATGV
jgi:hypothetical protein